MKTAALVRCSRMIKSLSLQECWPVPSPLHVPLPFLEMMGYITREQWKNLKVIFKNIRDNHYNHIACYWTRGVFYIYKTLFWRLDIKTVEFDVQQQSVGYDLMSSKKCVYIFYFTPWFVFGTCGAWFWSPFS